MMILSQDLMTLLMMRSRIKLSQYISTNALILKAKDYKEADQLLTVYTQSSGKLTVLAKGLKKNQSKLRGSLQIFRSEERRVGKEC